MVCGILGAALFSIIPGFGQFYNRQWAEGYLCRIDDGLCFSTAILSIWEFGDWEL